MIVPVLNEVKHIERTIESLLGQDASHLATELLFVDGGSTDGTREIIKRYAGAYPSMKLLDNPRRTTPVALNIGLRAAQGEYVGIFGAHASYPPDYVRICCEEMEAQNAAGCSGRLLTMPSNQSLGARLAAWCMGHRFASSGSSVRTQGEGYATTIPFPVFRKQALIDVGGYDETLDRNQDNDMNERLRASGHRLYLTARIHAVYYARPGTLSLLVHAFNTGKWNGTTIRRLRKALSLHHFVPFAFVVTVLVAMVFVLLATLRGDSVLLALLCLALPVAAHLSIGVLAGLETAVRQRDIGALLLPPVILAFHIAYGLGTLAGLLGSLSLRDHRLQVIAKHW